MMTCVAVHVRTSKNKRKEPLMHAFAEGVLKYQDDVVMVGKKYKIREVAFIYGLPVPLNPLGRAELDENNEHYRAKLHRVQRHRQRVIDDSPATICIEGGIIAPFSADPNRMVGSWWSTGNLHDSSAYWTVGYYTDGPYIQSLDCCEERCPSDRWERLGYTLDPWRNTGSYVLVLGMNAQDHFEFDTNYVTWGQDVCARLKLITDRLIIWRPHPNEPSTPEVNLPHVQTSKHLSLTHAIEDAWCVVDLASSASMEAVIQGVPAVCLSKYGPASQVAGDKLEQVLDPPRPDREEWAHRMAYRQWTLTEIAEGLPWARLRRRL